MLSCKNHCYILLLHLELHCLLLHWKQILLYDSFHTEVHDNNIHEKQKRAG